MFYTDVLQVLAVDKVEYFSQPIGIIVAGLCWLYCFDEPNFFPKIKFGQKYIQVKFLGHTYCLYGILENSTAANAAVSKVKVTYTDQQPPILTMEDAIQKKSIFPKVADELKVGDAEGLFFFQLNLICSVNVNVITINKDIYRKKNAIKGSR